MPPIVHLIRHGQALHNVNPSIEGYNKHHDPLLSKLGESQSLALRAKFQHAPDLVVVSPLQRTLQTALIAFGDFKPPVQYLVSADIQEDSDLHCNRGSHVHLLQERYQDFNFDDLLTDQYWPDKRGLYEPTPTGLSERGRRVRLWLKNRPEKEIAVVSHRGFLEWVVGHWGGKRQDEVTIGGLETETEGWENGEIRTFEFVGVEGDGEVDGKNGEKEDAILRRLDVQEVLQG